MTKRKATQVTVALALSFVLWPLMHSHAQTGHAVGIAVVSNRSGGGQESAQLAKKAFEALKRENVPGLLTPEETEKRIRGTGFSDSRSCEGGQGCLRELATLLGPEAVLVSVDFVKVAKKNVAHLECTYAGPSVPLAQADVSAKQAEFNDKVAVAMTVFAREVAKQVRALPTLSAAVETAPASAHQSGADTDAPLAPPPASPVFGEPRGIAADVSDVRTERVVPVWAGIAPTVVGVAGVAVGAALLVQARGIYDSLARRAVAAELINSEASKGESYQRFGWVAVGVGAGLTVLGVTLFGLSAKTVTVTAALAPDGRTGELAFAGRW